MSQVATVQLCPGEAIDSVATKLQTVQCLSRLPFEVQVLFFVIVQLANECAFSFDLSPQRHSYQWVSELFSHFET